MEKYLKAIENNICKMCIDSNDEGKCVLSISEKCAVELYLPQIVEIVHELGNDDYDMHYKKFKTEICVNCKARDEKGFCYLKENSNCALDRYYAVIEETIKKVDSGKL